MTTPDDKPDLELRAAVAVEVMGWASIEPVCTGCTGIPKDLSYREHIPRYESSLDACRDVLAEIERRGITNFFVGTLIMGLDPPTVVKHGWAWVFLNATAADICRSALHAVREANLGGDDAR